MKRKAIVISILAIIFLTGFFVGKALLDASCCSDFSLNCCCRDLSKFGAILSDYECVCSGGSLIYNECLYVPEQ
jgi:hypothetical protein